MGKCTDDLVKKFAKGDEKYAKEIRELLDDLDINLDDITQGKANAYGSAVEAILARARSKSADKLDTMNRHVKRTKNLMESTLDSNEKLIEGSFVVKNELDLTEHIRGTVHRSHLKGKGSNVNIENIYEKHRRSFAYTRINNLSPEALKRFGSTDFKDMKNIVLSFDKFNELLAKGVKPEDMGIDSISLELLKKLREISKYQFNAMKMAGRQIKEVDGYAFRQSYDDSIIFKNAESTENFVKDVVERLDRSKYRRFATDSALRGHVHELIRDWGSSHVTGLLSKSAAEIGSRSLHFKNVESSFEIMYKYSSESSLLELTEKTSDRVAKNLAVFEVWGENGMKEVPNYINMVTKIYRGMGHTVKFDQAEITNLINNPFAVDRHFSTYRQGVKDLKTLSSATMLTKTAKNTILDKVAQGTSISGTTGKNVLGAIFKEFLPHHRKILHGIKASGKDPQFMRDVTGFVMEQMSKQHYEQVGGGGSPAIQKLTEKLFAFSGNSFFTKYNKNASLFSFSRTLRRELKKGAPSKGMKRFFSTFDLDNDTFYSLIRRAKDNGQGGPSYKHLTELATKELGEKEAYSLLHKYELSQGVVVQQGVPESGLKQKHELGLHLTSDNVEFTKRVAGSIFTGAAKSAADGGKLFNQSMKEQGKGKLRRLGVYTSMVPVFVGLAMYQDIFKKIPATFYDLATDKQDLDDIIDQQVEEWSNPSHFYKRVFDLMAEVMGYNPYYSNIVTEVGSNFVDIQRHRGGTPLMKTGVNTLKNVSSAVQGDTLPLVDSTLKTIMPNTMAEDFIEMYD